MSERVFVDVIAAFRRGHVRPVRLIWPDGRTYEIDRVLDVRRAPSKSGGAGIRYTCRVCRREMYLYFDEWEYVWWCDSRSS